MDEWELHSCGMQGSLNVVGCSLGSPTTVKQGENCKFDEVADRSSTGLVFSRLSCCLSGTGQRGAWVSARAKSLFLSRNGCNHTLSEGGKEET